MTNRTDSRQFSATSRRQRGLGLVEILIAMALFLFMLSGLLNIFLQSRQTYSATDTAIRLHEGGRTSIDLITASLRRAGYMGDNSDIDTIWGTRPPLPRAATCATADDSWVRMIEQDMFGLDDSKTGYACLDSDYLRGDVLTVRHASPWRVDTADMVSTRLYLRSSLFEGKLFLGSQQADGGNTVLDTPQTQHELLAHSYFVGDSGRSCAGSAIPALFRISPGADNLPVAEELIPGVENLQFQYEENGRYVNADQVSDWEDVVAVKMWVLVRSDCPDSTHTDTRTYLMGDLAAYTPADNYRRYLYSTVVAMRNIY